MTWDARMREGLETAINESVVEGVRIASSGGHVDVLLQGLWLPPVGPLARDGRRILRLTDPGEVSFLLRPQLSGDEPTEAPVIPLADMAAVEDLFAELSWSGATYGWRFFDAPELARDWPAEPSLSMQLGGPAAHTFYWFNECGVERDGLATSYCLEGTVSFDDLAVLDASERVIPLEEFVADGVRQWDAFYAHDDRLSVTAQRAAQRGPTWRRRRGH